MVQYRCRIRCTVGIRGDVGNGCDWKGAVGGGKKFDMLKCYMWIDIIWIYVGEIGLIFVGVVGV